jgi:hypothetical protein
MLLKKVYHWPGVTHVDKLCYLSLGIGEISGDVVGQAGKNDG